MILINKIYRLATLYLRVCLNFVFGAEKDEFQVLTRLVFDGIAVALSLKIAAVRLDAYLS